MNHYAVLANTSEHQAKLWQWRFSDSWNLYLQQYFIRPINSPSLTSKRGKYLLLIQMLLQWMLLQLFPRAMQPHMTQNSFFK